MTKQNNNSILNKQIATELIDNVLSRYPDWNESKLNLPKPINSPKLNKVDLSNKIMAQVPLDDIIKSVLCGTIVGDSSFGINKGYKNARFQAKHSTRQVEWFVWKYLILLKEFTSKASVIYTPPDGYQLNSPLRPGETVLGKLKIASKVSVKLTKLHEVICVHNRKTVKRSWLNHMNNYFLMTIWLDDGSLTNGRQGLISFNSMPVDEQDIFRDYLLTVWEIETKREIKSDQPKLSNGQDNYVIIIKDQDNLMRLLRLIAPVIPVRGMLDKVCFLPKEKSLLERWRTELVDLVRPEFKQDVIDYYNNVSV